MLASTGEILLPCGQPVSGWITFPPSSNPRLQPFPNQPQEWPIVNPQLEHLQKLVVIDAVEEIPDVNLDDVTVATKLKLLFQRPHRFARIPAEPVGPTAG